MGLGGILGKIVNPIVKDVKTAWPSLRAPAEAAAATAVGQPELAGPILAVNTAASALARQKQQQQQQLQLAQQEGQILTGYQVPGYTTNLAPLSQASQGGLLSGSPVVIDSGSTQPTVGPVVILVAIVAGIYFVARGHHGH